MDLLPFLISIFSICLISGPCLIQAQQPYIAKGTVKCDRSDNSTSVLGYTCNGLHRTCQSYLTFRSLSPYNSVSTISHLLGATPSRLAHLNSVPLNHTFDTNRVVLVPVNCSCSGQHYQVKTSYLIQGGGSDHGTYFLIANNTFQGLSTCQALDASNGNLTTGQIITVPLRCACPTSSQIDGGINYLLSYLVTWGQYVSLISSMFGVDTGSVLAANQLSFQNTDIYPFTTLLVPLQDPPSSMSTISPPPPPPSPSSPPPPPQSSLNSSSSKAWVYAPIGALVGGGLVLLTGIVTLCMMSGKSEEKFNPTVPSPSQRFESNEKPNEKNLEEDSEEFLESIYVINTSLRIHTFEELKSATGNFSPSRRIKGSVYHGTFKGEVSAAIKKMEGDVSKEINVLKKVSHFNLISLSGVCFNEGYWYLVYEYAVNGPLSDWIYSNNSDDKFLNWTQRVQIALDVAVGLNYIHNYTSTPYVHKDVKCSNVLLDGDFRAKIANFGLARSADGKEGEFALTRHIVGTKGYMAPEYLEHGFVSPKLDVYAFGVLVLEILTGKEVSAIYEGANNNLSEVLIQLLDDEVNGKEKLGDFMDPSLQGNYPADLVILVAKLADTCIAKYPSNRPGMDDIVQSLSKIMTSSLNWELSICCIPGY